MTFQLSGLPFSEDEGIAIHREILDLKGENAYFKYLMKGRFVKGSWPYKEVARIDRNFFKRALAERFQDVVTLSFRGVAELRTGIAVATLCDPVVTLPKIIEDLSDDDDGRGLFTTEEAEWIRSYADRIEQVVNAITPFLGKLSTCENIVWTLRKIAKLPRVNTGGGGGIDNPKVGKLFL